MPIYEYQCGSCGGELEKLQRMSDAPLTDCPDCGEAELQRLVSAAGFRLKGAGWYETDFKQGGKRNLHDNGNSASKNSSASKPEAKPVGTKKTETAAATKSGAA